MIRSTLFTFTKHTMGRVRRLTSTKQRSMTLVVRSFRHKCRGKLKNDSQAVLRAFLISSFAGSTIQVLGSTDLSNGKAWHVAMTYDGSSTAAGVKLYVNGVAETPLVINNSLTTSIRNDTVSALVGARPGPSRWFKGDLDELAIYTSALPASTILDHANKFWGYTGDPGGQVPVILDTDLASDVDDVGDLAVLNALERKGEARLVGVIVSSINDFSAPAARAYNTY